MPIAPFSPAKQLTLRPPETGQSAVHERLRGEIGAALRRPEGLGEVALRAWRLDQLRDMVPNAEEAKYELRKAYPVEPTATAVAETLLGLDLSAARSSKRPAIQKKLRTLEYLIDAFRGRLNEQLAYEISIEKPVVDAARIEQNLFDLPVDATLRLIARGISRIMPSVRNAIDEIDNRCLVSDAKKIGNTDCIMPTTSSYLMMAQLSEGSYYPNPVLADSLYQFGVHESAIREFAAGDATPGRPTDALVAAYRFFRDQIDLHKPVGKGRDVAEVDLPAIFALTPYLSAHGRRRQHTRDVQKNLRDLAGFAGGLMAGGGLIAAIAGTPALLLDVAEGLGAVASFGGACRSGIHWGRGLDAMDDADRSEAPRKKLIEADRDDISRMLEIAAFEMARQCEADSKLGDTLSLFSYVGDTVVLHDSELAPADYVAQARAHARENAWGPIPHDDFKRAKWGKLALATEAARPVGDVTIGLPVNSELKSFRDDLAASDSSVERSDYVRIQITVGPAPQGRTQRDALGLA